MPTETTPTTTQPALAGSEGKAGPNYGQQGVTPGMYMSPGNRRNVSVDRNKFFKPTTFGSPNTTNTPSYTPPAPSSSSSAPAPQPQTGTQRPVQSQFNQAPTPGNQPAQPEPMSFYAPLYQYMTSQGYGSSIASNLIRDLHYQQMVFTQNNKDYFLR